MDRRVKAALHRDKGPRLNEQWQVGAVQSRYHEYGYWYATLTRFPAALFDASGYVVFANKTEYQTSPHLQIGKQIGVSRPGISAIPGYVRMLDAKTDNFDDVDIHDHGVTEGSRQLVFHLARERKQSLVLRKKKSAASLNCEACKFSFSQIYGATAAKYCEVHHLVPLGKVEHTTRTRMQDLAILCANCHRVVHLRNPPYTLEELRAILSHA